MNLQFSSTAKILFILFSSIFLLFSPDQLYSALIFSFSSLLLVISDRHKKCLFSLLVAFLSILLNQYFPVSTIYYFNASSMIFLPFLWSKEIFAEDFLSLPIAGKTSIVKGFYMIFEISSSFIPYMRSEMSQTLFILKTFKLSKKNTLLILPSLVTWSVMKIERRKINLYLSLKSRGFRDTDDLNFWLRPIFFSRKDILPYSSLIILLLLRFII